MKKIITILILCTVLGGCTEVENTALDQALINLETQSSAPALITFFILDKSISKGSATIEHDKQTVNEIAWPRLLKHDDRLITSVAGGNSLNPNNIVTSVLQVPLPKIDGLEVLDQKLALAEYYNSLIIEKRNAINVVCNELIEIEAKQKQTELLECLTHVSTILNRYPDSDIELVFITDAKQVSENWVLNASTRKEAIVQGKQHAQDLISDFGVEPNFGMIDKIRFQLPQDSMMTEIVTGNYAVPYWNQVFSELGYQNEVIMTSELNDL